MNVTQYVLLAYVLGLGLMVGYGVMLWAEWGSVARRKKRASKLQGRAGGRG